MKRLEFPTSTALLDDLATGIPHDAVLTAPTRIPGVEVHLQTLARDRRGPYRKLWTAPAGDPASVIAARELPHDDDLTAITAAVKLVTVRAELDATTQRAAGAALRVALLSEVAWAEAENARGHGWRDITRVAHAAVRAGITPATVAACAGEVCQAVLADDPTVDEEQVRRRAERVEARLLAALEDHSADDHADRSELRISADEETLDALSGMSAQITTIRALLADALRIRDDAIRSARAGQAVPYAELGRRTGLSRPQLDKIINRSEIRADGIAARTP